jgi:sugar lactone lactonase YvrE
VTTVAGSTGISGSNDGTGSAARFNYPISVAVNAAGNVYIADYNNHLLRVMTPGGVVSTVAGATSAGSADGSGSAATFNMPRGVAVDSAGNAFVADVNNHTIRKITPAGLSSTIAGLAGTSGSTNGTGSAARFRLPRGIAVASAGDIFVADTNNNMIRAISPAGAVTTFAGATAQGSADGSGTAARFNRPNAIAGGNSGGFLYIADTNNHTIRKISPSAFVTTLAGLAGSLGSNDGVGTAARFAHPRGIASDGVGNVYVADSGNHTIRKIANDGTVTTLAGSPGLVGSSDGAGGAARFNNPEGLALSSSGDLYVADRTNHLIRKITPAGVVSTVAGFVEENGSINGTGSAVRFYSPVGIAASPGGRLHVTELNNNTVRVALGPLTLASAASTKHHINFDRLNMNLALSGTPTVECRSGGASGDHIIIFRFSHEVVAGSVAVTSGTGTIVGTPSASGIEMVVQLTGVADAQTVALTLNNVADSAGQSLPETTVRVSFLAGDTNGNGAVTASDIGATKAQAGQPVTAANFRNDVTPNGAINASDIGLVKSRSGTSLPPTSGAAVAVKEE